MQHTSCARVTAILRAETFVCSNLRLFSTNNIGRTLWSGKRVRETSAGDAVRAEGLRTVVRCCGKTLFRTGISSRACSAIKASLSTFLLRSNVQCNTCGRDLTWSAEPTISGGFSWRCRKKFAGVQVFRVQVHKARFVVPAQASHLPQNFTHHVWHREPRTCPPYPKKEYVALALLRHLLKS